MTTFTPVEGVVNLLTASGFRRLSSPLSIAGLSFEVPAALVGEHPSPDLILVADTAFEADVRILRKVEGVARALDVARSKRPLTTILVGPKPKSSVLDAMTKVCRVLATGVVGTDEENPLLQNWLAVLLPLALPEPSDDIAEPLEAIIKRSDDLNKSIVDLIGLGAQGADAVQAGLHELLKASLTVSDEDAAESNKGTNLAGGIFE
ncbi:hypothetical protein B5M44_24385 [Shinella sumterensis]|uniref:hypothetical protein n=1 Tax=Shinella sumterensis TaxID=1967501 RepID=UPI00106E05D2|nr:hypothetical protein [Shinella sumterensis]MCD1267021.1 hypothetical protein [Shinella sumterensis]TFE93822.1 hypothetical protein B5M44_24385 [Shinella sumterensis]